MIAVYEYPDYVQLMSYPFFLNLDCTTSPQDDIVKAAKSGFCPSGTGEQQCPFQFVASCFNSNYPQVILIIIIICVFFFFFFFFVLIIIIIIIIIIIHL